MLDIDLGFVVQLYYEMCSKLKCVEALASVYYCKQFTLYAKILLLRVHEDFSCKCDWFSIFQTFFIVVS